jgi:hypothetical protein
LEHFREKLLKTARYLEETVRYSGETFEDYKIFGETFINYEVCGRNSRTIGIVLLKKSIYVERLARIFAPLPFSTAFEYCF